MLALKKYGKDWQLLRDEIPSRTVVQIRTHSQKFFLKLARTVPANKNLVEFVKENPLAYFINLTNDEFCDDFKENSEERGQIRKSYEDASKSIKHIKLEQITPTEVIQGNYGHGASLYKLNNEVRDRQTQSGNVIVLTSNLIKLTNAIECAQKSMQSIIAGIWNIMDRGKFGCTNNTMNLGHWWNLYNTAIQLQKLLTTASHIYYRIPCVSSNNFYQHPLTLNIHQKTSL